MLSSNKMTDDQRINIIRMSNPPTDVALCLQNLKKNKKRILSLLLKCGCLCLFRKFSMATAIKIVTCDWLD